MSMRVVSILLLGAGLYVNYQNEQVIPELRKDNPGQPLIKFGFLLLVAGELQSRLG